MKEASPDVIKRKRGHPQLIGYARVSRRDQNLDSQVDALTKANCCRIYQEKVSGAAVNRAAFSAMMETLRPGDVVVVGALDRMGRRLSELIRTLDVLREMGCHIRDVRNGIDTSTRHGDLVLKILMVLAESERELIRERTREGLAAAAQRGRKPGRPTVLSPAKVEQILHLHARKFSVRQIATTCHVAEATVRKALELADKGVDKRQARLEGI